MKMKQKKIKPRGNRRFGGSGKLISGCAAFVPHNEHKPYGENCPPVTNLDKRKPFLKFLPANVRGAQPNFAQAADDMLGKKQMVGSDVELCEKLDKIQALNDHRFSCEPLNPNWNEREISPELLQEALSKSAKWAIKNYPVIQKALARLYAVAWFGRGDASVKAKQQLMELLPKQKKYPITRHIPEITLKFQEMRRWILESDKLMKQEFPNEIERVEKLATLYDETVAVISAALHKSENSFLTNRLTEILSVPAVTIRKELAKISSKSENKIGHRKGKLGAPRGSRKTS